MNLKKLFLFGFLMVLGVLKGGEPVQASLSGVLKTSGSAHLSLPFNSLSSFLNYFKIAVFSNKTFTFNENELDQFFKQGRIIKYGALAVSVLATYGMYKALKTERGIEAPKNLLIWGKFLTSAALGVLGIFTFRQLTKPRTLSKVK
jgi:hypothetical protein